MLLSLLRMPCRAVYRKYRLTEINLTLTFQQSVNEYQKHTKNHTYVSFRKGHEDRHV